MKHEEQRLELGDSAVCVEVTLAPAPGARPIALVQSRDSPPDPSCAVRVYRRANAVRITVEIGQWSHRHVPPRKRPEKPKNPGPVLDFLAAHTERTPGARASASEVYSAYMRWCARSAFDALSQAAFGRALTRHGWERLKAGIYVYVDMALIPDPAPVPPIDHPASPEK